MATTTTNLLTWEAFEQIPDDGMHREILEGELIVLPPAKSRHTLIVHSAAEALFPINHHGLGKVLIEAGYRLSIHPPTWIQPDISVLIMDRVTATNRDGYFEGSPELAIEVVSPSETARDLNRKIDLLVRNGTLAVWVIYPEEEEVRVFLPDGTSLVRGPKDILTIPEPFGAFEISVGQLFGI
jgi:Uma2 family endonuclease